MADERYAEFMEETPKSWVQGLFEESSTKKYPLGTIRPLIDGREFIYAQAGTTTLVAGQLQQAVAPDVSNLANLAVTANIAANERYVPLTMGDTAEANTANAFEDGYLWVSKGVAANGVGITYKIRQHAAIAANANGNIWLYDKIRVKLVAANAYVSIKKNPCKKVISHDSPPTSTLIGVATYAMSANYYGWLQKRGPVAIEVEEGSGAALTSGKWAYAAPGANGCITGPISNANFIDAGISVLYPVGIVLANNANDHWALIDLKL